LSFPHFHGNQQTAATLAQMIEQDRIPQTILLAGPEGVGKATLARRFAANLLGERDKIEKDDLSLPENAGLIAEREKLPADKRAEDPLLFSTHPDFITFPPEGPLRQISIQQMRLLKERAQFKPLHGRWRVFLIDHLDRANEQAANSLLKTLEEPPDHLILIATAENAFDLLPTIRSRSVILQLTRLTDPEMQAFVAERDLPDAARRVALAAGSPGIAVSLDMEVYDARRAAMLALLAAASGVAPFAAWVKHSESIGARKSEKLEAYLQVLYLLLGDLLSLRHGDGTLRNADVRKELSAIAGRTDFGWLEKAIRGVDELVENLRRNIQKSIALDALVVQLRSKSALP
jgi:DNA polymerase III subunit delta'